MQGQQRSVVRLSSVVAGAIIGAIVAAIIAGVVLVVTLRDNTPLLTRAAYDDARRRWESNGPPSYNLDLQLTGREPGAIHVEVRSGEVTAMTRDGVAPQQRRTWEYWSVDSQFDLIEQELDKATDPAKGFDAPPGSRVVQRAVFDPRYGYPTQYHRTVMGTPLEIRWEITRFEPVP